MSHLESSKIWDRFHSVQDILLFELETRLKTNPLYSLRSFARDLGLEPSQLSKVLKGKEGMSARSALRIADVLGYQKSEKNFFCDLTESQYARSHAKRKLAKIRLRKYKKTISHIELDLFQIISDWYHFAILELFEISGFQVSPESISQQLGISETLAQQGLKRLERVGLLKEERAGCYTVLQTQTQTPTEVPSQSVKNFHNQILQKAMQSLVSSPIKEREFSSSIFSFSKSLLPRIKKLIYQKNLQLIEEIQSFQNNVPRDSVYCFSYQFFELTKSNPKKETGHENKVNH